MEGPSPRSERKEVSDGSEVIYDTRKNLMDLGKEMMATCLHRSSVVKKGNHSMKNFGGADAILRAVVQRKRDVLSGVPT